MRPKECDLHKLDNAIVLNLQENCSFIRCHPIALVQGKAVSICRNLLDIINLLGVNKKWHCLPQVWLDLFR